jgi:UDP-glucose 4-epimerase
VKSGVKNFIFSSTAAVYGNPKSLPVFETDEPAPISPYGTSKLMTELMLRDSHAAYGLQLRGAALLQRGRRRSARAQSASPRRAPRI